MSSRDSDDFGGFSSQKPWTLTGKPSLCRVGIREDVFVG